MQQRLTSHESDDDRGAMLTLLEQEINLARAFSKDIKVSGVPKFPPSA